MCGGVGPQTLSKGRFRSNAPRRTRFTAQTTLEITSQFKKENPVAKLDCNAEGFAPIGFGAPRKPYRRAVFAVNRLYGAIYREKGHPNLIAMWHFRNAY